MHGKKRVMWSVLAVLVLLVTASTWVGAAPLQQTVGQQLLTNPGFEGINCPAEGWCEGNWTRDTYNGVPYNEIFSPEGWVTFWSEGANVELEGDLYGRPECQVIPNAPPFIGPPARVRSGNYAVKHFSMYHSMDAGLYQVVTGLSPGATIQAAAYAHAWACGESTDDALTCADQFATKLMVGIDPTGGTNPWSANIVWTAGYSYDTYRQIGPVQAQVGPSGTVTVFLRQVAKWPLKHNDVYWDDASLVYTTPPATATSTAPPPPPTDTPGPPPTPMPTSTPRPDGAIVHRVQSGDTLFGIALQYGVDVDQILRLNAGSIGANNMIWTGQDLVIAVPDTGPTAVPPTTTPEGGATPEPTAAPVGEATNGSVCVVAFNDRNGDTFRQPESEELLPNAVFSLGDAEGLVGQYTTDGLNEPYCFTGLEAGTYQVSMEPPTGYEASGPSTMGIGLSGATEMNVALGAMRGDTAGGEEVEVTLTVTPGESGEEAQVEGDSFWSTAVRWVARVGGVALLLLAVVIAAVFFLSRRR
jgi:LysM repeat protein